MKKRFKIMVIAIVLVAVAFTTACSKKEDNKEKGYDYLVLVNKYSKLPDDWEDNIELVTSKDAWGDEVKVEKKAYEKYKELKKALEEEGVTIELDSVYRSVKEQQQLWDDWTVEKGIDYVRKYVAVPGYSEHHTGLAIDICIKKDGEIIADNDEMIAEREIFSKIHEKLADYGFILRYLEGKDDITGYAYEPWHLRYINDTKIAKEIMDKGLTFEEYLGSITSLKDNEAAKYQIEKALQASFKDIYGDKIANSRFNVKKVYSPKEAKEDEVIKQMKLKDNEIAFEVEYELMPADDSQIEELTLTDGEYDNNTGLVKNIARVGVLRPTKNGKAKYEITDFGTGF